MKEQRWAICAVVCILLLLLPLARAVEREHGMPALETPETMLHHLRQLPLPPGLASCLHLRSVGPLVIRIFRITWKELCLQLHPPNFCFFLSSCTKRIPLGCSPNQTRATGIEFPAALLPLRVCSVSQCGRIVERIFCPARQKTLKYKKYFKVFYRRQGGKFTVKTCTGRC